MSAPTSQQQITRLLQAWREGDGEALDALIPLVYEELRRMARRYMRGQKPGHTLQTTALVNEAYMRLVGDQDPGWNGRGHFFGAAAQAMRHILIEQARRRAALKRGGDRKAVDLENAEPEIQPPSDDVLALDEALQELERTDPRKARLVLLHHFAGLTMAETAAILGVSVPTVEREWRFTRSLLYTRLSR